MLISLENDDLWELLELVDNVREGRSPRDGKVACWNCAANDRIARCPRGAARARLKVGAKSGTTASSAGGFGRVDKNAWFPVQRKDQ